MREIITVGLPGEEEDNAEAQRAQSYAERWGLTDDEAARMMIGLGVFDEEGAGARGEGAGSGVHEAKEAEAGEEPEALGDPAEGDAHQELQNGGDDRDRGLRPAHEMARDDRHQCGLRDDAGDGAAESEDGLNGDGTDDESDERDDDVASAEHCDASDVEGHAQLVAELAGEQAAGDGADGPAALQVSEAASAGVKNVVGERDENDVGADDARHHRAG